MLLSFIVFALHLSCEKNENKLKEAGFCPFLKIFLLRVFYSEIFRAQLELGCSIYQTDLICPLVSNSHGTRFVWQDELSSKQIFSLSLSLSVDSDCGSVDRAVSSDTRDPWFESCHWQNLYWTLFPFNCIEKTKIKKKRLGMAHFLKNKIFISLSLYGQWLWLSWQSWWLILTP